MSPERGFAGRRDAQCRSRYSFCATNRYECVNMRQNSLETLAGGRKCLALLTRLETNRCSFARMPLGPSSGFSRCPRPNLPSWSRRSLGFRIADGDSRSASRCRTGGGAGALLRDRAARPYALGAVHDVTVAQDDPIGRRGDQGRQTAGVSDPIMVSFVAGPCQKVPAGRPMIPILAQHTAGVSRMIVPAAFASPAIGFFLGWLLGRASKTPFAKRRWPPLAVYYLLLVVMFLTSVEAKTYGAGMELVPGLFVFLFLLLLLGGPILLLYFLIVAFPRSAQAPMDNVCSGCRYDLTGNVSRICPECGQPTPHGGDKRGRESFTTTPTSNSLVPA